MCDRIHPNLITTLTNITCLIPIYYTYIKSDFITLFHLIFVSLASIVSHLAENHKHNMPGLLDVSSRTSYILNKIDVLGSLMLVQRLLYLYLQKYGRTLHPLLLNLSQTLMLLIPFPFGIISEYNSKTMYPYLQFHPIWHLTIFPAIANFLYHFIY